MKKERFIGKYHFTGEYGFYSSIEIFPNQTFKYKWSVGLVSGMSSGNWKFEKGFIILNSQKQPSKQITDSYEVVQELAKSNNSVVIKVIDIESQPVPFVNCAIKFLNRLEKSVTNENGECVFEMNEIIEKISLHKIGYRMVEYVPDFNSNYFIIQLRETNENYEFFTNEKWKVKVNELIYFSKNGKQTVYKKVAN